MKTLGRIGTLFIAALLIISGIYRIVGVFEKEPEIVNVNGTELVLEEKMFLNIGETFSTDKYSMTLTSMGVLTDYIFPLENGMQYLQFEIDIENVGEDDFSFALGSLTLYADDYAMEIANDGTDMNLAFVEVSAGKKIKGTVCYEVPIDAQTIQIEYSQVFKDEKVIFKVK